MSSKQPMVQCWMSRALPEGHSTIARHKLILYANTTGEENVGPIADNVYL